VFAQPSRELTTTLIAAAHAWVALGGGSMMPIRKSFQFELERYLPRPPDEAPHYEALKAVPNSVLYEIPRRHVLRWRLSNTHIGPLFGQALLPLLTFPQQLKLGKLLERCIPPRGTQFEQLGNFLRLRRVELGLTRQELCRRMGIFKFKLDRFRMYETGRRLPNPRTAAAIARALDIPGFPQFVGVYAKEIRRWAKAVNTILSKKQSSGSRSSAQSTKSKYARKWRASHRVSLRIFSKLSSRKEGVLYVPRRRR
jgi:transcriptional regulator with XRE-family HTH domain